MGGIDPLLYFVFVIVSLLFHILFMGFIGAIFLRAAAKFVNEMKIPYSHALGTAVFGRIVLMMAGIPFGIVITNIGLNQSMLLISLIGFVPLEIFINTYVVRTRHELPISKAFEIALVMYLLSAVSLGIIIGVVALLYRLTTPY